ncbi:Serine/threonine-protein kinase [Arachnomyces sp. PD_36]|nr:Serine/threonine-protein kinase [Arachnomyces sp. PD_36]
MSSTSSSPMPELPLRSRVPQSEGLSIGRYTRLDRIGRGSFATVYQGVHTKYQTFVAIKSVNLSKMSKKLKDNLSSEIDILKGLHHPHIVALIDCHETTNNIHLVMEFCALGDLSVFIRKRRSLAGHKYTRDMIAKYPNPEVGGLNEVVVRHFLKQLSSALEFLRAKDLIHRDVKPQNLLLSPSPISYVKGIAQAEPYKRSENSFTPAAGIESLPMLKIADFGFARSLPSTSLAETLCGSPLYMAPEILRYEKYDASVDLWSVGTVLYEMAVGRAPFQASNHVDLLRKIELGKDKIRFPAETPISDPTKAIIRALLKRNPQERISFRDFFNSDIIKNEIPGLVAEDRRTAAAPSAEDARRKSHARRDSRTWEGKSAEAGYGSAPRDRVSYEGQRPESSRQPTSGTPRTGHVRQTSISDKRMSSDKDLQRAAVAARRPSIVTQATAPARQELQDRNATAVAMERQRSRNAPSPSSSIMKERGHGRTSSRDERERAAQEVAFERDYVVVEKRAVEVNAFADELAASPRLQNGNQNQVAPRNAGTVTRRATTQGVPTSTTGAQAPPSSKAMQVVTRPRADSGHQRQGSFERRYGPSPTSATSAISRAIHMAGGRLLGIGFSPPLAFTKGGRSPPLNYSPFPAYPAAQGSLMVVGDGGKRHVALDEDGKTIQLIEECATRSDVVYGFAEVKFKQIVPLAPSVQADNPIRPAVPSPQADSKSMDEGDDDFTADVIVTLSEEALVLYVKALSLLAKSMDIAGAWWARKNRGEISDGSHTSSSTNPAVGTRVNNVVQWVRSRFNEVLEKAEFVRRKLIENQKLLPLDHPSHPNNNYNEFGSAGAAMGTSVDNVIITSGITAEKLMYDRALEMSRTAAIHELTGEDMPGCELAYVTSIRMLEAVLENEEFSSKSEKKGDAAENQDNEAVEVEDREVLSKLIASIRARLSALRKKAAILAKRTSAPPIVPPGKAPAAHLRPVSPGSPLTGTPPK